MTALNELGRDSAGGDSQPGEGPVSRRTRRATEAPAAVRVLHIETMPEGTGVCWPHGGPRGAFHRVDILTQSERLHDALYSRGQSYSSGKEMSQTVD